MELVNIRNDEEWQHDEENDMTEDEISCKHAELGDLAQELTPWLGHGVPSHVIPFACPPSNVGTIRLELTSERERDDELVEEALKSHDSNHAQNGFGKVESFEDKHDFEEYQ